MYVGNKRVAYANYALYKGKIYIQFIGSLVKGKGYGVKLMEHLAKLYGYQNLERNSLTPDGAKMRKKLDAKFNFNYDEFKKSQSPHFEPSIINKIKNPIIANFLRDIIKIGNQKTWSKWLQNSEFMQLKDSVDFNDIADIGSWIKGSITNDHDLEDNPPEFMYGELEQLF